jgi:hypothetical protein
MSAPTRAFLFGPRLRDAIYRATASGNVDCAVAFWGEGAEEMFSNMEGRRLRIICNLRMGGTNPEVISKIRNFARVHHSDTLHAKVYLGSTAAVITSANASANGLGVDEGSSSHWEEAGYLVSDMAEIRNWFERLSRRSKSVTEADLERAKLTWANRQSVARSLQASGTQARQASEVASAVARPRGRQLSDQWNVGASHALYRQDGTWYHRLERFPGALFDEIGYIRFQTKEDLLQCPGILIGKERKNWLSVPAGIAGLPGYVRVLQKVPHL